ncbi:hypothetical protein, partial [Marinifilum sp. D737]|uniref:hypothetical protein n=1 Tax=Marinifilum sp. D737 TaxID=2969628 RepID=UPI002274FCBA
MNFEEGYLYHVYNRGNNKCKIFFNRDNYLFFLRKFHSNVIPYADILAWCLMPTHFHLMIYVRSNEISERKEKLNSSIGKILSSYTRAIQKQENFTGSLFQKHTKSPCLNNNDVITPNYFNNAFGSLINTDLLCPNYLNACFEYIHLNPVMDKLVSKPEDWEFSSYRDYFAG